ncbi:acyl transferase/acyl hydrolase/lysophospholipase [Truncatella angustata]|uniref:Acyl transferase/acyl hydrolase/lysophospholipase n=1 Tax=Truncatella angustata TaxID=152316 RepID=A0A9P8UY27_9PEZI|nr:acyl transferase/acyl hydrolase/lysophospholipase [Truncatella angustata]KAH6660322.1 acyl transferase/acyl hydrolase/lysophospholipase [Truncatella angustata]
MATSGAVGILWAVFSLLLEVVLFWFKKFSGWLKSKGPLDDWLDALRNAEVYEEWEHAALHLDNIKQLNLWRNDPSSKCYDWALIHRRLESLSAAGQERNIQALIDLVRAGLVRNLGNITSPKLYNRAFAGTKYLVEEYIAQVVESIDDINADAAPATAPILDSSEPPQPSISTQRKLNFLHDARQAFGRTTLVLQGGAIFGLCHLGVVKALFLRGLLPRIITGTATGALIASLVAIHTEDELPRILNGEGIDLSAFEAHAHHGQQTGKQTVEYGWETLLRRVKRFWKEGYFLDVKVLEECVKANVGDLTFEEAFNRSKRVLNITVATEGQGGVPTLLNYVTAPNVLIWTAAVASNASTPSLYGSRGTTVLCKDVDGSIVPWAPAHSFKHYTSSSSAANKARTSPLARIAQLFNVNHFIVSQARPYLIPFLESDMHGPSLFAARHRRHQITGNIIRIVGLETRHRLRQLDTLGLLPASIRRFLVDEEIPGATMTFVPKVTTSDFVRLLETPTRETLEYWILRGERSVWPAVCALRIRCAIEFEIERTYQRVRSLKAGGLRRKASVSADSLPQRPLPEATLTSTHERRDTMTGTSGFD